LKKQQNNFTVAECHGGDTQWRELKGYLHDMIQIEVELMKLNQEPTILSKIFWNRWQRNQRLQF